MNNNKATYAEAAQSSASALLLEPKAVAFRKALAAMLARNLAHQRKLQTCALESLLVVLR